VDATHYIDGKTGTVFSVDHLTLVRGEEERKVDICDLWIEITRVCDVFFNQATTESSQPAEMDSSLESQRSSLQTVLDAYVAQHYANADAAASVLAKDGKLIIHISGERPNPRNYWAGRWQSQWTLTPSGSNATLSGEIKVRISQFFAAFLNSQPCNLLGFPPHGALY
jgi:hypothetical protein